MAKFPQSPKIGQAFLDGKIIYVWSGYSWYPYPPYEGIQYRTPGQINSPTYSSSFAYDYYGIGYTGGTCSVILPGGNSPEDDGKIIIVADEAGGISSYGRGIFVTGTGNQYINGEDSILMRINRMSLTFLFTNNSWKTI
jgi:hypothetical protein